LVSFFCRNFQVFNIHAKDLLMDILLSLVYQVGLVLVVAGSLLIVFAVGFVLFFRSTPEQRQRIPSAGFFTGEQDHHQAQTLLQTKRA
jgi:hypothetical protein